MRNAGLTVFFVLTVIALQGCMLVTQSVYKTLQKKSDPKKELIDPAYAEKNEIFKGTWVGTVREKGVTYDQYQFENVLADPGGHTQRILEVRVPRQDDARAEIFETEKPLPGSRPAFWFARHIPMDQYAGSDVPALYFKRFYPKIQPADYRSDGLNIDLTPGFLVTDNDFNGDFGYVIYKLSQAPGSNTTVWNPFEADVDIRWIVRNRTSFELNRLRYLYSVPFDLVTFPIQMVILPFLK